MSASSGSASARTRCLPAFGARIFDCGRGGHSGYFRRGDIALRNLAYIALGDPAEVTR